MPSKSRQSHRGHLPRSKRKKGKRSLPVATVQQKVVVPTEKAATSVDVSTPVTSVSAMKAAPAPAPYPYVVKELRRIGVLAGVILVILIVLAVALP